MRGLGIVAAAGKAKVLELPRAAAKTIQIKRNLLRGVFKYADDNYDGVKNPFADKSAWLVSDTAASDQKDAFTPTELKTR